MIFLNASQLYPDFFQNSNSLCTLLQNRGPICINCGPIFVESNSLEWKQNRALIPPKSNILLFLSIPANKPCTTFDSY